jgi:hypothetical protein
LADGWQRAGQHEAIFNGGDLGSGVYLYRFEAGNFTAAGKLVLVK